MLLQRRVEPGAHRQHGLVAELAGGGEVADLVVGPIEVPVGRGLLLAVDRGRRVALGGVDLPGGEIAGLDHVVQHVIGAGARRRQVDVRGVFGRRLEQAGDHRRLGQGEIAHRLAEVELGGGLDAEGAATEVGAVEVKAEDLALGEMRLEPQRQKGLVDLARQGSLVGEEQVLGELLGQRRAALPHAVTARVHQQRPQRADDVDAVMVEEAAVLGGEQRMDEVGRQLVEGHRVVVKDPATPDLLAVAVEEGDGEVLLLQPVLGGQLERRDGQRQQQKAAGDRQGESLAADLDSDPPQAGNVKALHVKREAFVAAGRTMAAAPIRRNRSRNPGRA